MARRTIPVIEVNEVLFRWCQDIGKKTIARTLQISVNTVRDLIIQAENLGLKRYFSSPEEIDVIAQEIKAFKNKKCCQPRMVQAQIKEHHERLAQWWDAPHMTIRQMQRLLGEEGNVFSETSLRRYVNAHFKPLQKGVIHLITVPGREAQVDFGYAGLMWDPKNQRKRKAYAFVMTLSHSRYRFVRFVFKQDIAMWIDCHIRAFEFFGSVPEVIVIDNLRAGVIKPDLYDPVINRAYGELERHYGFVVDPARVRTPEHKGKVERNMPVVRQQILAGRAHADIEAANEYALYWARYEISQRVTRTTGETPWVRFERDEKAKLKPLPLTRFECPQWQEATVHSDHHVVFNGSFYSVPQAYLRQQVWLRASARDLKIYGQEKLIKIHLLAQHKGEWVTDINDYPEHARAYLPLDKTHYIEQAKALGEGVYDFVNGMIGPLTRTGQRKIFALFRLSEEYGNHRLNNACRRALAHGNNKFSSIKRILEKDLDLVPSMNEEDTSLSSPLDGAYLRDTAEFTINGGNPSWISTH
jgi:Integrase core domain